MSRSGEECGDKVLLFGVEVHSPYPAALLLAELLRVGALDVSSLGKGKHLFLVLHQILYVYDTCRATHHFGFAVVAKPLGGVRDFPLDDAEHFLFAL